MFHFFPPSVDKDLLRTKSFSKAVSVYTIQNSAPDDITKDIQTTDRIYQSVLVAFIPAKALHSKVFSTDNLAHLQSGL